VSLSEDDSSYLERALGLGEKGRGRTSPNPVVGAVIVRGRDIIGEGWHVGPGRDHAEVAAIKDVLRLAGRVGSGESIGDPGAHARDLCAGTTMYVTLEPCCTQGRTPPCTSALLAAGFTRVVVGAIDPTPQVNGKSLELLRAAGVQIDLAEGDLARRMKRHNDGPRKVVGTGLPFVTYKYAMTLDGRVATDSGDSRWISGAQSRALVHQWRAWSDAVVVGAGTLLADDPRLTAREVECTRQPLRVVVDRELGLRRESTLVATVKEGPVLVVCGNDVGDARRAEVVSWGVETIGIPCGPDGALEPLEVGRHLASRGVQAVLLEGGPRLAGAWWTAGLIDKVAAFVCPRVVSGEKNLAPLRGPGLLAMQGAAPLQEVEIRQVGSDVLICGYREGPF
jgi:diaminohydroxyphosphoribosylaminopyrimidine deaminase / 5-amino-6-(5-phosphoribosylamino)uracil reductase